MSNDVLTMCRPLVMKPVPKAVLNCLADHANTKYTAWPAIPTICMETGFRRSSVIKALNWLKATELIVGRDDPGRVTVYQFNMDVLSREFEAAMRAGRAGQPVSPVTAGGVPYRRTPVHDERRTRPRGGPEASKQNGSNTQATITAFRRESCRAVGLQTYWMVMIPAERYMHQNRMAKLASLMGTAEGAHWKRVVVPEGLHVTAGAFLASVSPGTVGPTDLAYVRPPYRLQRHWVPLRRLTVRPMNRDRAT